MRQERWPGARRKTPLTRSLNDRVNVSILRQVVVCRMEARRL